MQELPSVDRLERLKALRANILKARVIQVELASEEDGFLIFETLNTRGADLLLSDLIKNLLVRGGATAVADRQAITDRWQRFVDRVQDGRSNANVVDRFIWQSWNSRRDAVKEPELYKAVTALVGTSAAAHIDYLQELETDSLTYEWLEYEQVQVQPAVPGARNAFAIAEFVDSVRALAIFDVSVANSTILAVARKYQESRFVSRAQLIEVGRLVENFHFQFTALTNSGSTGGTRGRYNRFAVLLEKADTAQKVADAIQDLKDKLTGSLPDQQRAETAFRNLFYAPKKRLNRFQKLRGRKIFIAYVLMAFAKHNKLMPAGQMLGSWSIEHIRAQSTVIGGSYKDPVYSIGNLTLLTSALNSALGDAPLPSKLAALRAGSAYFDAELDAWVKSAVTAPSDSQITDRARHLAQEALGSVWKL